MDFKYTMEERTPGGRRVAEVEPADDEAAALDKKLDDESMNCLRDVVMAIRLLREHMADMATLSVSVEMDEDKTVQVTVSDYYKDDKAWSRMTVYRNNEVVLNDDLCLKLNGKVSFPNLEKLGWFMNTVVPLMDMMQDRFNIEFCDFLQGCQTIEDNMEEKDEKGSN